MVMLVGGVQLGLRKESYTALYVDKPDFHASLIIMRKSGLPNGNRP